MEDWVARDLFLILLILQFPGINLSANCKTEKQYLVREIPALNLYLLFFNDKGEIKIANFGLKRSLNCDMTIYL